MSFIFNKDCSSKKAQELATKAAETALAAVETAARAAETALETELDRLWWEQSDTGNSHLLDRLKVEVERITAAWEVLKTSHQSSK